VQQFPAFTMTEFQNGLSSIPQKVYQNYLMSCSHYTVGTDWWHAVQTLSFRHTYDRHTAQSVRSL